MYAIRSYYVSVKAGEKITSTGLVVAPEDFKPATKRPKDFDKYWKAENVITSYSIHYTKLYDGLVEVLIK